MDLIEVPKEDKMKKHLLFGVAGGVNAVKQNFMDNVKYRVM